MFVGWAQKHMLMLLFLMLVDHWVRLNVCECVANCLCGPVALVLRCWRLYGYRGYSSYVLVFIGNSTTLNYMAVGLNNMLNFAYYFGLLFGNLNAVLEIKFDISDFPNISLGNWELTKSYCNAILVVLLYDYVRSQTL